MNGFEVQEHLSAREHRIPVVVLTGQDTPESYERATAGGAAAYLRKPVDGGELLAAVAAAIAQASPGLVVST
jgi:DNA-binding NarL/FixJ family response regulator